MPSSRLATERHRIGWWHHVRRVHRQALLFVAQLQVLLQSALVHLRGLQVGAGLAVEFDVPPPFLDRVDRAVVELVVECRQPARVLWHVHRQPAKTTLGEQSFEIPRAGLHAAPTHRAGGIGDAVAGALLRVAFPDLVAVVHQLRSGADRARRAFARALVAVLAKVCRPKSIGLSKAIGMSVVTVPLLRRGPR